METNNNKATQQEMNNQKFFDCSIIIATLVCLIPILFGVILWDKLPESIPTKYGLNDEPRQLAPKWVTVFLLPVLFAVLNLAVVYFTAKDKNAVGRKQYTLLKFICPLLSVISAAVMLAKPLGLPLAAGTILLPVCSVIFILCGNYMPKLQPNKTVGIRLPATLRDAAVWKKVHRLAGFVWVLLGFVSLVCSFTPAKYFVFFAAVVLMVLFPIVTAAIVSHRAELNTAENGTAHSNDGRKILIYLIICFVLTWSGFFAVMYTGGLDRPEGKAGVAACMLIPAISVVITMLVTKEGFKNLYIKPKFKHHIKYYLAAWLVPVAMTVVGGCVYFLIFPSHFDGTMNTFIDSMTKLAEQTADSVLTAPIPQGTDPRLLCILQLAAGVFLSPLLNFIPCFGEELGWRGFLLPRLTKKFAGGGKSGDRSGKIKAILVSGLIWGLWHAPVTCMGHNYGTAYPGFPFTGILTMTVFCTVIGTFMAAIFYKTESMIPAVITHAVINGFAAAPMLFLSGVTPYTLLGPSLCGLIGCCGFIILALVFLIETSTKKR